MQRHLFFYCCEAINVMINCCKICVASKHADSLTVTLLLVITHKQQSQ